MIPRANITAWRREAPWPTDAQVEQDLVISRALVELYRRPGMTERLAFRGGTALHKLFLPGQQRYSEDINLVRREAGPIKVLAGEIRAALDPWLGEPRYKSNPSMFTLTYRFVTSHEPVTRMRLKIEINTREHDAAGTCFLRDFAVDNPWFTGSATIATYGVDELLATKLRALYQRKKGRDLFDLWLGLDDQVGADPDSIVQAFGYYLAREGVTITRAQFERNMAGKLSDPAFLDDVRPLIRTGVQYDAAVAWARLHEALIIRLPGDPWKGDKPQS